MQTLFGLFPQKQSDLGLHCLFGSVGSNIFKCIQLKNNSVDPDQAISAVLI